MQTQHRSQSSTGFPQSHYIHLNVGGGTYTTSRETLTRYQDSMLGSMFTQDKIPLAKDEKGHFMIDRDGEIFKYILNFLRNGNLNLPQDFSQHKQLLAEARFYQLTALERELLDPSGEASSPMVTLVVVGVSYVTARAKLMKYPESLLCKMFSEETEDIYQDERGQFVIDRDGRLFCYILNFLRDNHMRLPGNFAELEQQCAEVKFYQLTDRVKTFGFVHLKVGGVPYVTTKSILKRHEGSRLEGWFKSQSPLLPKDHLGHYIINRDGQVFAFILNLLEDGQLHLPPDSKQYLLLEQEAQYYKLAKLTHACKVNLMVGMSKFILSRGVLTKYKGSLLEEIFSQTPIPLSTNESGFYTIDRDGEMFVFIANYLKRERLVRLPASHRERLRREANYFRLEGLPRYYYIQG